MKSLTLTFTGVLAIGLFSGCGGSSPDTTDPVFTSAAKATVAENQTNAITLTATDDDGSVTITIISGGDAESFTLVASGAAASGQLGVARASMKVTFKSAPDIETKDTYTFTAKATDAAGNTATQEVTIHITDACESSDTITHNGTIYGCVVSPYTGKVWLDRNLGADKVCDKSIAEFSGGGGQTAEEKYTADQQECFGDYYQWGRGYDGHQDKNCDTTNIQAADVNNPGDKFITLNHSAHHDDWTADTVDNDGNKRVANWSKTDGTSVCPAGYRVATLDELKEELFSDGAKIESSGGDQRVNAYNTFLKLPPAGRRYSGSGAFYGQGGWGGLWAATADGADALYVGFVDGSARWHGTYRAFGLSVRCLRDNP